MIGLILLTIVYVSGLSNGEVSFAVDQPEPRPGETFVLTCTIDNFKSGHLCEILKYVDGTTNDIKLSTNMNKEKSFGKGTDSIYQRYELSYLLKTSNPDNTFQYDFNFTVRDATLQDGGKFVCRHVGDVVTTASVSVYISKPPNPNDISLTFFNNSKQVDAKGKELTFQEHEKGTFECKVEGASPIPKVSFMVGNEKLQANISDPVATEGTGAVGFKGTTYSVTASLKDIPIKVEWMNKPLVCQVEAEPWGEPYMVETTIKFDAVRPHVDCMDNTRLVVRIYSRYFTFNCTAHGIVDSSHVFFYQDVDNFHSLNGTQKSKYKISVSPPGPNDDPKKYKKYKYQLVEKKNTKYMVFEIARIFPQDLRTFYFEASNVMGATHDTVTLVKDPLQVINASVMLGSSLLSLLAMTLAALLLL